MKVYQKVILAILIFGLIEIMDMVITNIDGQELKDWKVVEYRQEADYSIDEFDAITLPYIQDIKSPGVYEFSTVFVMDDTYDSLSIRRMNGYAFQVELNGQRIYEIGEMDGSTANIWNYNFLIDLPQEYLQDKNVLLIRAYGLHDIGFNVSPVLTQKSETLARNELLNFLGNGISFIIIGASWIMGFVLILISRREQLSSYFSTIGLSMLFFSLYNFEYTYREYSGSLDTYLLIRKLLIFSILISVYLLIQGVLSMIYNIKIPKFIRILYLAWILPIFFSGDFYQLRRVTRLVDGLIVLLLFYLLYYLIRKPKRNIAFATTFLILTSFQTSFIFILDLPLTITLNFGVIVFMVSIALALITDISKVYRSNIELEYKATRDKLTGANNREYLDRLQVAKGDTIAFIDIDNFKRYNDTYGHNAGDNILIYIVDSFKQVLDDQGAIIRYGGDEFVIHMPGIDKASAKKIIDNISLSFSRNYDFVGLSYGLEVIEDNLDQALVIADQHMYTMKDSHKDERQS